MHLLQEWGLFEYNYTYADHLTKVPFTTFKFIRLATVDRPLSVCRLTNGRTILEDMVQRPVDGRNAAQKLLSVWTNATTSAAVTAAVGETFYSTVAG